MVLAVSLTWPPLRQGSKSSEASVDVRVAPAQAAAERRQFRQLRFLTSGGTQVIWLLEIESR
jgi:hypothetical protein